MTKYPQNQIVNLPKLVDTIMLSSDSIRRVIVIDDHGHELYTKATDKSLIGEEHVQVFARDIDFLRKILGLYDDMIGETKFAHFIRTKGQFLFFNYGNWIYCVSCDYQKSRQEIADISDDIEKIIKNEIN